MNQEVSWLLRSLTSEQEAQAKDLARKTNLHPLLLQILFHRNVTEEAEIQKFLNGNLGDLPDPFLLPDMDRAVDRLLQAMAKREKVLFFGDYDVDGITGTAQLQAFFREMDFKTTPLLPRRLEEGYGLNEKSVRRIALEKPDLLVTIDNGTRSQKEISALKDLGIETIVLDHHETPLEDQWPPVVALINPKRGDSKFPDREVASAGLAFLLIMALRARCRERGISPLPNLKRYLDLACLGTIADVVPLKGTNRILVKFGLKELEQTTRPGLQALKEIAGVQGAVQTSSVGFRLAPRINAAGRLKDPRVALDLLLTQSASEAGAYAAQLEAFNQERQRLEEIALREAIQMVEKESPPRHGIVVASQDWHLGVVGIVAARLTEKFGRPSIVLAIEQNNEARGSGRTVSGFSIYDALKEMEEEMLRFGGHAAAAGMTVATDRLEIFSDRFDEAVRKRWEERHLPKLWIDSAIRLHELKLPLMKDLALLEPHGMGNPEPVLVSSDIRFNDCRIVGTGHLKAVLSQEGSRVEAIGFNLASHLKTAQSQSHRVAFTPQINFWNGIENVQIKIRAIG